MINSEYDLWQLFGGEGPDVPGKQERTFNELHTLTIALDVGQKQRNKPYRPRFELTDQTRFYRLRCLDVEAVVDQARLFETARRVGDPDLSVSYLGVARTGKVSPRNEDKAVPRAAKVNKQRSTASSSTKRDSIDKIVASYFATLTSKRFEWRGRTYEPRDVFVSPLILRGYTCPAGCGGCCPRFSLDYIVPDYVPKGHPLTSRLVEFDGRKVEVWSDMQDDHDNEKCRNLNFENGRCRIHGSQPFSCDFELLRTIMHKKKAPRADFTQKLYGRGWAMMRVDGERGALCEMTPVTDESVADVDRRLVRLARWMEHFGLDPVRVGIIRVALPEIAASGEGFTIPRE